MKYVKLFEDFDSETTKLLNSSIENSLVELIDAGIRVSCKASLEPNSIGYIMITNFKTEYKIDNYKENFNYLYDILIGYDYRIYRIVVNHKNLGEEFDEREFDYIWNRIIESSEDKFQSIQFSIYKNK